MEKMYKGLAKYLDKNNARWYFKYAFRKQYSTNSRACDQNLVVPSASGTLQDFAAKCFNKLPGDVKQCTEWVVHRGSPIGQNTDPHPDGLPKWTTLTLTLITLTLS